MSEILVCPQEELDAVLDGSGARTMVAFGAPDAELIKPLLVENFMALHFNDIAAPRDGLREPRRGDIDALIGFVRDWNQASPLLLQCWMGISRSTAAAAISIAALRPQVTSQQIARSIREASPMATPNPLMIAHADALLDRDGSLVAAIANIGRGADARLGVPFSISLDGFAA